MDVRPRLKLAGRGAPTGPSRAALATADPLWKRLVPLKLDPLTVVEDPEFGQRLVGERNLPEAVREGVREVYGG